MKNIFFYCPFRCISHAPPTAECLAKSFKTFHLPHTPRSTLEFNDKKVICRSEAEYRQSFSDSSVHHCIILSVKAAASPLFHSTLIYSKLHAPAVVCFTAPRTEEHKPSHVIKCSVVLTHCAFLHSTYNIQKAPKEAIGTKAEQTLKPSDYTYKKTNRSE